MTLRRWSDNGLKLHSKLLSGLLVLEAFGPIAKIAVEKLFDEEKKNAEAVLLERTITLIEDMLFFAKRNRDVRETSGK
ncbi:hypothetical protein RB195_003445 [Necator americanus]|uniref:Uncharacterized protein n=1 Tax=Necator americanus TaxID=51031 RepID=A0ABR1DPX6_NECAM